MKVTRENSNHMIYVYHGGVVDKEKVLPGSIENSGSRRWQKRLEIVSCTVEWCGGEVVAEEDNG